MSRNFEQFHPILSTLLIIIILYIFNIKLGDSLLNDISNYIITIFSIFCGFSATSLSILFTIQDKDIIKKMKSFGTFYEIIVYLEKAMFFRFTAIAFSFRQYFL